MAGQDWIDKDFYKVLGVAKDASGADIKKAYRKLSRKHHPDMNQGDAKAEKTYKDITEAYTVLSDPKEREQYDAIRAMGSGARFAPGGAGGSAGFDDLFGDLFNQTRPGGRRTTSSPNFTDIPGFENLFGGGGAYRAEPRKGPDIQAETTVSFAGALRGTQVGLRKPDGEVINVRIPKGVKDGQKVRVRGRGHEGTGGKGDLVVTVHVKTHELFTREGDNIRVTVPVSFPEATLGAQIEVPTIQGVPVTMKIPAGTASGKTLRLKGKGVETSKHTGDMLVTIQVVVPQRLTDQARAAVEAFAQATRDADPRTDWMQKARL